MNSFSSELGVAFPIQLEANHVIADSQVMCEEAIDGCAKDGGQDLQNALRSKYDLLMVLLEFNYRTQCILVESSLPPFLAQSSVEEC